MLSKRNRLVYGVGINDADYYVVRKVDGKMEWICPYYRKWKGLLQRCYSKKFQEKNPTYKGCIVCNEWLYFSNFKRWMEKQNCGDRQLDKDFLVEGCKVYSPSTCVFLPSKLNSFITTCGKVRGYYPLGVSLNKKSKKNPYQSDCNDGCGGKGYLGLFPTPEEAHQAWLVKKLKICEDYILEFKDEPLIIDGLTRIRDKIKHYIDTNTELTSF